MQSSEQGKIITFYSYKGGTGRSMALANVAWILASNEKKVLVLDWDLEAPGLHRYFYPFLVDKDLSTTDGLIDFVIDFAVEAATHGSRRDDVDDKWYEPYADIISYAVSLKWDFGKGTLDFISAGRQGPSYSTRVNSFNWQKFYDQLGGAALLEMTKQILRAEYDYILIDSRTGVSDTAGICTVQMPDKLVVCFTLNNQSIDGASAVAESVYTQRKDSGIEIFPVPMRIENAEQNKRNLRLEYAQERFEQFPRADADEEWKTAYWKGVGVIYIPFYAYEEILACFGDSPSAPLTLTPSVENLTAYLTDNSVTQLNREFIRDRDKIKAQYSELARVLTVSKVEQMRRAERLFLSLSPDKQAVAKRVLLRLVELSGPEEENQDKGARVSLADFDAPAREVIQDLSSAELVAVNQDGEAGEVVRLTSEAMIKGWSRLRNWISQERQFLFWRQLTQPSLREWKERSSEDALRRPELAQVERWLKDPRAELNASEREYLHACFEYQRQRLIKKAEKMFADLKPKEQYAARRVLTRMVRIVEAEAVSKYASAPSIKDTRAHVRLNTFDALEREIAQQMANAQLVTRTTDPETCEELATIAHEFLITDWERLNDWIADDRNFLIWRQEAQNGLRDWEQNRRDEALLLRNAELASAEYWLQLRRADLNQAEQEYISASLDLQEREQSRTAERVFALLTAQEQEAARRVLIKMVQFARPEEGEQDRCQPVNISELSQAEREILKVFCDARLIAIDRDNRTGEEEARILSDSLLKRWNRLSNWISDDREFMLWRQEMKKKISDWERSERKDEELLLRDLQLAPAEHWLQERQSDLYEDEQDYIRASLDARGNIEKLFAAFNAEQEEAARRALTRMVCLAPPETGGKDTLRPVRLQDLDPQAIEVAQVLSKANIVEIIPGEKPGQDSATLANESLMRRWPKLKSWLKDDRQFLHWRQQLGVSLMEWEKAKDGNRALLTGKPMRAAKYWLMERKNDLNDREKEFIAKSVRMGLLKIASVILILITVVGVPAYQSIRERREKENEVKASVLNADAREYANNGDLTTAIKFYDRAIETAPDFAESYIYRGKAFIENRDYDEAITDLTKSINLSPDSPEPYKWRGIAHFNKSDYDMAIKDFDQAIRLASNDSLSYDRRARAYLAKNDYDRAAADFDKAIEIDPNFAEAYHDRGKAYASAKNFDQAIKDYNSALTVDPGYSDAYLDLAKAFLEIGDRSNAIVNFQKAYFVANKLEGRQEAEKNLRQLKAIIPEPAPAKIFIHHQEENDITIVSDISDRLTRRGFNVVGLKPDSREGAGEVRYYYVENKVDANYVKRIVEYSLDLRKIKLVLKLSPYLDLGSQTDHGTVEVWLPKLPSVKNSD